MTYLDKRVPEEEAARENALGSGRDERLEVGPVDIVEVVTGPVWVPPVSCFEASSQCLHLLLG